jgi:fumarate reductase subunit C
MSDIERAFTGFFDQLNPFSLGNLVFYFVWLTVYSFTLVAVWRSGRAWARFVCFVVNQVLSVGVLISLTLTALLAYTYWLPSALVFLGVGGTTFYMLRRRP